MVCEWTKDFGPISNWSKLFAQEFDDSQRHYSQDSFAREWRAQADVGRALLKDVQSVMSGRLPRDEKAVKDIVQQSFKVFSTLQEGICIIDAHLKAFNV
jgi:hypothetical protein